MIVSLYSIDMTDDSDWRRWPTMSERESLGKRDRSCRHPVCKMGCCESDLPAGLYLTAVGKRYCEVEEGTRAVCSDLELQFVPTAECCVSCHLIGGFFLTIAALCRCTLHIESVRERQKTVLPIFRVTNAAFCNAQ